MRFGFEKEELRNRYDVGAFDEDPWHSYCGERTKEIVQSVLLTDGFESPRVLNAGSGVYGLGLPGWREVAVDLFESPLNGRRDAICANLESMPLACSSFQAVVCVGEVVGYCDPQLAFREFNRVLSTGGILICDFGSTTSFRYLNQDCYGREADLNIDVYNGSEEKVWIYHPDFIRRLLRRSGFRVDKEFGTHTWSAAARTIGLSPTFATTIQRWMNWLWLPKQHADVLTIVAVKTEGATE